MTNKEEYNKMIKQIFGDKLRKGLKEFIYQWHIQQQIKLLEEVKKDCVYKGTDGVHPVVVTRFNEDKFDSKITNLKGEL